MTDQAEKIAEKIYELAAKRIVGETDIVWSKESIASLIRSHTAPRELVEAAEATARALAQLMVAVVTLGLDETEPSISEVLERHNGVGAEMTKQIAIARSALSAKEPKVCEWVDDDPFWIISCQKVGLSHSFHEPVIVRKWKACPYCTNPIEVKEGE